MPIDWNDISRNANGGTELMAKSLERYIDVELLDEFQIIPSRVLNPFDETKYRIYWSHDLAHDPNAAFLKSDLNKIHRLVFVSHWQQQSFINQYRLPWSKTNVLLNAIDKIDVTEKPDDKINLIYTSTPHRGLNILLPVFKKIAETNPDLHLHVYSSFSLYGWPDRDNEGDIKRILESAKDHPQITYYGARPNEEVREALKQAHIFAYPSIWPETSCIALMEAMSAGCLCVHPDFAALPETAANWTWMYTWHENQQSHASVFYDMLLEAIAHVRKTKFKEDVRIQGQKSYADVFYSWDMRKVQWTNFLKSLQGLPKDFPKREEEVLTFSS